MLKIATCDDTKNDLTLLETLITAYQIQHPELDIQTYNFSNGDALLFALDTEKHFDLYILDVLMPEMTGISLGKKIRAIHSDAVLIYTTASKDYAIDAFSVYAFQYLLKPVSNSDFNEMMNRFLAKSEIETAKSFLVKTKGETVNVFYNSISYIECRGHLISFILTDKTVITSNHIRIPFTEYSSPILKDSRFLITHKSYIVNLDFVQKMTNQNFTMLNGETVPISRKNYSDAKQKYLNHISVTL